MTFVERATMATLRKRARVHEWVNTSVQQCTDITFTVPELGFVESLYRACSSILPEIWKYSIAIMPMDGVSLPMETTVVNLCLWTENFPPGELDTILENSGYLKINIVDNLSRIGRVLIRRKCLETSLMTQFLSCTVHRIITTANNFATI